MIKDIGDYSKVEIELAADYASDQGISLEAAIECYEAMSEDEAAMIRAYEHYADQHEEDEGY